MNVCSMCHDALRLGILANILYGGHALRMKVHGIGGTTALLQVSLVYLKAYISFTIFRFVGVASFDLL